MKTKKTAYAPPVSSSVRLSSEGMLALSAHPGTTAGSDQWGAERGEDFSSGYWGEKEVWEE